MFKMKCTPCKLNTNHKVVDSVLDTKNGWKVSRIRTQGGCRDSAADYRTVQCSSCGFISTWDFATD